MATGVKYAAFLADLVNGVHNFQTDVLKIALTDRTPDAALDAVLADIVEIAAVNGYTAGGNEITFSSVDTANGYRFIFNDPVAFTGAGIGIGPFQYAVLYNDTAAGKPLIGYWDNGASILLAADDTLLVDLDQIEGTIILQ